jgi:hypothetical protein
MATKTKDNSQAPVDLSRRANGKIREIKAAKSATGDLPKTAPIDLEPKAKGAFNPLEAAHDLRREWADRILQIFRAANIAMTALVFVLAATDIVFLYHGTIQPDDRWLSEAVILSVIGATVVQVGAAAFAITQSLFRGKDG